MDKELNTKETSNVMDKGRAIAMILIMVFAGLSALYIVHEDAQADEGGPDDYGYLWTDSNPPSPTVDYSWIEISGSGTSVGPLGDEDTYGPYSLGFSFNFYGTTYSDIWIHNNGFLMFTDQSGLFAGNDPIPNPNDPNNIAAAFWDDLWTSGDIYYESMGLPPNRYFVVEWKDVENYNIQGVGQITFQAVLYEGNYSVKYQYQDVVFGDSNYDYGASASIGIENSTGWGGLEYSHDNATLSDNMAIEFMSYSVDYLMINDTAGGGGNWVGDKTYLGGETDTFHAHGFNVIRGYLNDVDAEWVSSDPLVGNVTSSGSSTTFTAIGDGTCYINATYGGTLINDTGIITVIIPPEIKNVIYTPMYPNGSESVTVYGDLTDSNGIQNATLYYSYDDVVYTPVDMSLVGGDSYSGDIPGPGYSTMVYYYLNATDNNDNSNKSSTFSFYADSDIPDFALPRIDPEIPNAETDVDVSVNVYENSQVDEAKLFYSYDGSTWSNVTMADLGGGTFYSNYVEGGGAGWMHYPLSGPAGDNWQITSVRRKSPVYSWYGGVEPGAYFGDTCIESPLIKNLLPGTNLSFWHYYSFVQSSASDGGIVEINDGGGWAQIFPQSGYDDILNVGSQNPLEGKEAFTYISGGWLQERFDLSSYEGSDIRIRFHQGWNNVDNGPREGWYIDNIVFTSENRGWSGVLPSPGYSTEVFYYVGAADTAGNYNETGTYSFFAGSDLALSQENISINTHPAENGSSVDIKARVANTGGPLNSVEVKFFLGDPDIDNDNIIDVAAQEIGTSQIIDFETNGYGFVKTTWSPPALGSYDIYVWADATNGSWEFDETNNMAFLTEPVFQWTDSFYDTTRTESYSNITFRDGDATLGFGNDYDFDISDEGFVLENDAPNSQVGWDTPNNNVFFIANNTDSTDDMFTKSLSGSVDETTGGWTLSGSLMITTSGVWQRAIPLFIANSVNSKILDTPDTISFEYYSAGGAIRGTYRDSTGVARMVLNHGISLDTQYNIKAIYEEPMGLLTLQILDENDALLKEESYKIGSNPSDGFTFGKLGVGTNGPGNPQHPVCTGWTDDISFHIAAPLYLSGKMVSNPIVPPSDGQWIDLFVNKTTPINTDILITLVDADSGLPIPGFIDLTMEYIDVSVIDRGLYPSIKIVADFVSDGTSIPKLHYFGMNFVYWEFSMQLYTGWNMISLPLNKTETEIQTIFASLPYIAVQSYDASDLNDPWKNYHIDKGGFNDLSDVDKSLAIWILMGNDDSLTIYGIQPNPTDIQLKEGWNFVGYPSLTPQLITDALSGLPYDAVKHYNVSDVGDPWKTTTQGDLTWMIPGEGYWIHVTSDCVWTIDW
jgi:hypothetical protein